MTESSGESPSPSQKRPDPARPAAAPGAPAHLSPAPRIIHPSGQPPREPQVPPSTPPLPVGLNEALEWIRQHADKDALPDRPPDAPLETRRPTRSLLPKEQRKFHKFDPEHPDTSSAEAGGGSAAQTRDGAGGGEIPSAAELPRGITSEQLAFIRRMREEKSDQAPWYAVGVAVFAFLLVALAFLAGHGTLFKLFTADRPTELATQGSADASAVPSVLSAGVLALIDQAVTAETQKNYAKAIALLEQAQHDAGHINGLDYQLAALCFEAHDTTRALSLLNRSITQGENVAACSSLRGVLSNANGDVAQGMKDLETAARLDPFNARYPALWAEALRRAGEPRLAMLQLKRAVERLQEPTLIEAYSLKVRLTQIEQGREDLFAAEMADKLKLSPPPVEWLLTAAALEMHRSNFPAATELLLRVRMLIDARETQRQLQDIFFQNFSREEELANFFKVPGATPTPDAP